MDNLVAWASSSRSERPALPPLTMETVLNIHKRVLFFDEENSGIFRKSPVYVGEKQMPDAERIAEGMASLLKLNEEDPFRRIAHFHLSFENLHPFIDGNGRTGRMLINLQLLQEGFLPINIKYNAVGRYYRCFRQYDIAREKGIQEMFNLITKYEHDELTALMQAIRVNGHMSAEKAVEQDYVGYGEQVDGYDNDDDWENEV